jgi:hypothetical protein
VCVCVIALAQYAKNRVQLTPSVSTGAHREGVSLKAIEICFNKISTKTFYSDFDK